MTTAPYGFRIVGPCSESRRLVKAAAALSGYAACDNQAEVTSEAYLSAFQFGDEFRRHLDMTGSTKGYHGPCCSPWLWSCPGFRYVRSPSRRIRPIGDR